MTKTVSHEVARRGITVNAVAPGFIETDMTKDLLADVVKAIPARRAGPAGGGRRRRALPRLRRRRLRHRHHPVRRRRHVRLTHRTESKETHHIWPPPSPPRPSRRSSSTPCPQFGAEPSEITREATFEDLDVDSLDLAELSQIIEDEFGVQLKGDDVGKIKTVGDAIDLVVSRAG